MSGQTEDAAYIPLAGGDVAVYHGATLAYYRHADGQGSSRLASTPSRTIYSAAAYGPFGEPYDESGTTDRSFTGQNQDAVGGQRDFLMPEYSPIQGRWWSPDPGAPSAPARWGGGPAGLAVVDPNDPQTWNRYAYINGNPLSALDPLGLQPCNTAALRRPGPDQEADGFGPYPPDEDGAAAQADGDCGAFWNQCSLDGASMDCGLMQELDGMSGGGGGESIDWGGSSVCNGYACPPTVPGPNGNPVPLVPVTVKFGQSCAGLQSGPKTCTDLWGPGWAESTGISPQPLTLPLCCAPSVSESRDVGALVEGFAGVANPLELAAANAAMFFTGAALVTIGYTLGVAGCLDPTPFEPLTCGAGVLAGAVVAGTGLFDLSVATYLLRKATIPACKEWW